MSGSLNRVCLIGNLGADPEVRSMQSGDAVCNLRIATTDTWKDKDGAKQEKTEWHSVVIWNQGLIRVVEDYLRKGSKVYLEGQLQTRKWQDSNGADKYSTEIVLRGPGGNLTMLDSPGGGGGSRGGGGRDRDDDRGSRGRDSSGRDDRGGRGGRDDDRSRGGSSGSRGTRQRDDDGWGEGDRDKDGRSTARYGVQQRETGRGGTSSGGGNTSGGWSDDLNDDIPF